MRRRPWDEAPAWARDLRRMLAFIIDLEVLQMATMAELQAAVVKNTDAEDAVILLLNGIAQQLRDALASGDPAALTAVITQLEANNAKLAEAVVANTPAA